MLILLFVRRLGKMLGKNNLGILMFSTLFIIILGTVGSYLAESPVNSQFKSLGDGLWWTLVTISTVGYGDKVPVTIAGRIIGGVCMVAGPVFMVSLIGSVGVSVYNGWTKGIKGMVQIRKKGHIIICGWNNRAEDIISELKESLLRDLPIVIIDGLIEAKPVDDPKISFVKGNASELRTLKMANIAEAKYAVVLAESNTPAADQKTVLTVLAIEKTNPAVITLAELIDANNEEHLIEAGCGIIINSSLLSSRLLAMSLQNPSTNAIIRELISQEGNEIYRVPVPEKYIGHPFLDTLPELKKLYSVIVIGIDRDGKSMVNPASDEILKSGDIFLAISEEDPRL